MQTTPYATSALPEPPSMPAAIPGRRLALHALGGASLASLLACGGGSDSSAATDTSGSGTGSGTDTGSGSGSGSGTGSGSGSTATCSVAPDETAGPYPADGSTASSATYNVLSLSGIQRSDIRYNIGSSTPVDGVPLTITITLTNTRTSCSALSGYAIYLWHCTQDGNYSVYTERNIAANYLRGLQVTDANGSVTFTTIVPGCYSGRMPHMHLEIYPSLAAATAARNAVKTTQIAFPTETLRTIYNANSGYSASIRNLASITFATDNVFSDGTDLQMATMQANANANANGGYAAAITFSIAV